MALWLALLVGFICAQSAFSDLPGPDLYDEELLQFTRILRDPNYRLPTTSLPRHYEVNLTPYFDNAPTGKSNFSFDGEVAIYLSPAIAGLTQIVMHCEDLVVSNVTVEYTSSTGTADITASNQDLTCQMPYAFLTIATSQPLVVGQEYVVKMTYTGNLQSEMRGFYRSWYVDNTGLKRWMGTTQFQPGHARKAFPCYDEPSFKATFDITIYREEDFSPTISNMPLRSDPIRLENGRLADSFHTTPKMSTYLIAFIVSHYTVVSTNNDEERPFEIYARNNVGITGNWSREIGELLLDAMERYTGIPYYNISDNMNMKQAAIPDFSAGAMENWGLLTYREALLLYDPENSNHFYRQRVANIVAHEITHMWIGNLVTCAWWDNLYLNEGFARFYTYYLAEMVAPDMKFDTRFVVDQVQVSQTSDSLDSAHPLTDNSLGTPASVSAHFSTITYAKGASIIRMTQHLLGNDTYVKGMRIYLNARKFDVAEPQHLFDALDEAAVEDGALEKYRGITISEYFKTWSEKAGHPLLTVVIDHQTGQMIVTQSRFERNTGISTDPSLWYIPITWTRENNIDFTDLKPTQILSAQVTVLNRGTTGLEWVLFNKQQSGYYRVNYDPTTWILITNALRDNTKSIHELNRAQIVNDVFSLGRAGIMTYQRALNILSYLEFEDEYAPWIPAITGFNFLIQRLQHDADNLAKLKEEIIKLSAAATQYLGFANVTEESYIDGLMRLDLYEFLCDVGHPGCVAAALENFSIWRQGGYVPPNMRPWVYCVGLREGSAEDFTYFWNRYLAEDLSNEKVVMLQVAGCTRVQSSLEQFLDAIVSGGDAIREQDFTTALSSAVTDNDINAMRVFEWLKNNVEQTIETLGSVATPLSYIAARLRTEAEIVEFENWLEANRDRIGTAYSTGISGAGTARSNLEWSEQRIPQLVQYFETGYVDETSNLPNIV